MKIVETSNDGNRSKSSDYKCESRPLSSLDKEGLIFTSFVYVAVRVLLRPGAESLERAVTSGLTTDRLADGELGSVVERLDIEGASGAVRQLKDERRGVGHAIALRQAEIAQDRGQGVVMSCEMDEFWLCPVLRSLEETRCHVPQQH